jgi:hypothetical protein
MAADTATDSGKDLQRKPVHAQQITTVRSARPRHDRKTPTASTTSASGDHHARRAT